MNKIKYLIRRVFEYFGGQYYITTKWYDKPLFYMVMYLDHENQKRYHSTEEFDRATLYNKYEDAEYSVSQIDWDLRKYLSWAYEKGVDIKINWTFKNEI